LVERLFCAGALAAALGMSPASAQTAQVTPPPHDGPLRALTPVPAQMLLNPPDNDWLMWRRTYNAWLVRMRGRASTQPTVPPATRRAAPAWPMPFRRWPGTSAIS
jgi:hypothetical protein